MGENDFFPIESSTTDPATPSQPTFTEFATQMAELMKTQASTSTTTPTPTITYETSSAQIGIKLDGSNYALWSQVIEMYVAGKDKLGYLIGELPAPSQTPSTFNRWRTENAIVKGWLINSMEPRLIGNFIRFPTAKGVWDAIATTYFDGTDTSQVYDLKMRISRMRQGGGSIETYYNDLQGLWREINFRRPNEMKCELDIKKYYDIIQEDRVYIFLDGLDDRLDKARSDVLQMSPFPTVEQAYAHVRREDIRQAVMLGAPTPTGVGLATKGTYRPSRPTKNSSSFSDSGNCGYVFHTSYTSDSTCWIIDSGATDHMTFDPTDFLSTTTPQRTSIANANGVTSPVVGAGTIGLSPSLTLQNTLLVPSLSNKLMSVGQATEQLNCCVLMYPDFCLFQDILTKEIIGRGTKRGGLYYVDDFSMGKAHSVKHSSTWNDRQLWLWHRHLGHPSFGYMRHLFPDLSSNSCTTDFQCDTCILAKSHRASYPSSTMLSFASACDG
ncbi:uncharacterized protein LOC110761277 [Prunus avium]|uniref:Uncharacterized protein LOC110761277 n=1 Tax=Prunus avium TaxID=42229 RepID=A0A6P5SRG6_PRUAV|nr:uncharacterized protein LOC110761277 [Prunus avium]